MDTIQIEPTIKASLSNGWNKLKQYFLPLLLVVIVWSIAQSPLQDIKKSNNAGSKDGVEVLIQLIRMAYWLLLMPIFVFGADMLFVRAIRNQEIDFKVLIEGFGNYLNIVLTNLFITALIGISFIALIIPGIIVGCRLVFVSFLVMDKGLNPIEAVETSWKMTRGYGWRIFGLALMSILICIGGFICLIVGILPALIWVKAAFASLYQAILNERPELFAPKTDQLIAGTEGQL